ncbi:Phosphoglycerate mutase OS=Tsukamurella paurometabola (strain ATCC 8368 / DSM / CCUG 35730 /CIP 100753 / JCM 10117 / KCTC 9821 / NBRC 16120 / NCIMB 702349/ NCTC 13040) OX=521096 GN=Tpau_3655 PE=4 SV=1 [Tsukamurella paurometabola]|uniref:Phosphoglycerate mutase n=1 Tax=Tsukamurella paurometabola (strain ATCC 8368 / DSM 20162 / CCUG 35730 / CIP 100753 / JCM 10117 / KCTC 9821 / NBRC 16120 / NCIMB 702349 / NCTC 13040) TaxID=521096 RepID=D5UXZ6_TSUPD|nr:histidine phosphatase family protein [Tsukamurella paurometabola]ADG80233.1 Phosphoglycerate mutase [Tsukamurella paurometabola DSM 20162]SUP38940.1 Phosphoglyceromutase [Tsukamurella paurometabola]
MAAQKYGIQRTRSALAAGLAVLFLIVGAFPAWAARDVVITFVRHAQSEANAGGFLGKGVHDSEAPGPGITATGREQAAAVVDSLAAVGVDRIFASNLARTWETARPLAKRTGLAVEVLPGLREISAGPAQGHSIISPATVVMAIPALWTVGLRAVPMPGGDYDANGRAFERRVNGAIQTIYDSGAQHPVAFTHGGTMLIWTLMNVKNPSLFTVLTNFPKNTGTVTVSGNPEDGWVLESWMGVPVSKTPGLVDGAFVAVRDLLTRVDAALVPDRSANAPTSSEPTVPAERETSPAETSARKSSAQENTAREVTTEAGVTAAPSATAAVTATKETTEAPAETAPAAAAPAETAPAAAAPAETAPAETAPAATAAAA